ncbi:helix-turn-helix domain-containing protein [Streptomyces sp. NPDC001984]
MPRPTPPDERVLARRRAVGAQIRRLCEHHNLSQHDVCGRSGIDVATYSRIEQGHSLPLLDTLIRIADAIGGRLEELVPRPPLAGWQRRPPILGADPFRRHRHRGPLRPARAHRPHRTGLAGRWLAPALVHVDRAAGPGSV